MVRKIVTKPQAALTEVITPEQVATAEAIAKVAKEHAEIEKKAKNKADKERKEKTAQIKADMEQVFSYTVKKIPDSYNTRFKKLKELGVIESSTSFNTYFKRALLHELKRNEEENKMEY